MKTKEDILSEIERLEKEIAKYQELDNENINNWIQPIYVWEIKLNRIRIETLQWALR